MENNKTSYYIDESNILSQTGHSVYACVCIEYFDKEKISQKIKDTEENLKISYTHWVDMPWKLRSRLAQEISGLDFSCKIVIYNNPINQKDILMNFLIKVAGSEEGAPEIFIDGKQSKIFKVKFKTLLRKKGIKVYGLSFVNDKTEPLIRIADFIAGLYRSYLDTDNKESVFIFNLLKHKIKILD